MVHGIGDFERSTLVIRQTVWQVATESGVRLSISKDELINKKSKSIYFPNK